MSRVRNIPYERQMDSRKCGAAALCMVYRSFGQPVQQADVWSAVSNDQWSARTHLLARDAIERGFAAMVVQAREPLPALDACHHHEVSAILNHRLYPRSRQGHYSVFLGKARKNVVLHDPMRGPGQILTEKELRELWSWEIGSPEVTGHVLVALAPTVQVPEPCPDCGETMPATRDCTACGKPIPLSMASVLGCGNVECERRTWRRIFCPYCDQQHRRIVGAEPAAPVGQKTMISVLADYVKERVDMAIEKATDPQTRETLQMISGQLDTTGPTLEAGIREQLNKIQGMQRQLDGIPNAQQKASAATKEMLEAKKKTAAAIRAERKAERKKEPKRLAPLPSTNADSRAKLEPERLKRALIELSDS